MPRKTIAESFVGEFVIGFGFLSGLFFHIGLDPEAEISKVLLELISIVNPSLGVTFSLLFFLAGIITIILSIIGAHSVGGNLGLVAVGLAFFGGIFIESSIGICLLIAGVLLGWFAPSIND
jgi:hypothetical protein